MYSLTDAAKTAFKKYHKDAEITFYGTEETRAISSADIWGLELTRASVSGGTIAIGEFCASTLTLTLNNGDGDFSDLKFSGGELYVRLKVTDGDGNTYYLPLGYFLVDSAPRKTKKITVECYDRAVLFDYVADFSGLTFPATLAEIAAYCITQCAGATGMKIATDITVLPNGDFEVESAPEDDLTYRQVLMAIAEITGTVAHMNAEGNVEFGFYTQSGESLTVAERYSHDLYEDDTVITGVVITDGDGEEHVAGSDTYAFAIEDNALLTGDSVDFDTIAVNIYAAVQSASVDSNSNLYYRAYEAETISLPYLDPLDIITYTEADGTEHPAIITNITFVMNGKGKLEGRSDSTLEQGLSSVGALTAKQKAIIAAVTKTASDAISELDDITTARVQAVSALNETISNALGLYVSTVEYEDGSTTTIFHNASILAASTYLFIMTGNGFAYANEWGGSIEETTWTGGIDKSGNAIVNTLTVYQITADQIAANAITTEKIAASAITTAKLAADSVTGDNIASDTITADNIAANTITADQIAAGTITGDNIASDTITADNIKIGTEDGLAAVASSGKYSDLTGTPETLDLQGYIYVDGTIGSTPAEGATGFVVSSTGLLQASNAVIYGTIYASAGTIGGLTLSENSIESSNGNFFLSSDGAITITGSFTAAKSSVILLSTNTSDSTSSSMPSAIGTSMLEIDGDNGIYFYQILDGVTVENDTTYDNPFAVYTSESFELGVTYRHKDSENLVITYSDGQAITLTGYSYVDSDNNLYGILWSDTTLCMGTGGGTINVAGNIVQDTVLLSEDDDAYGTYTIGTSDVPWKGVYGTALYYSTGVQAISDRRRKHNIADLSEDFSCALIAAVNPCEYALNSDTEEKLRYGFIAQDIMAILKNMGIDPLKTGVVSRETGKDGETYYLGYTELIAPLVKCVQVCMRDIKNLKKEVNGNGRGKEEKP